MEGPGMGRQGKAIAFATQMPKCPRFHLKQYVIIYC